MPDSDDSPQKTPASLWPGQSGPLMVLQRGRALAAAFFLLVSITAGFAGGWFGSKSWEQNRKLAPATRQQVISSESQLINDIAKQVGPSVVSVNVTRQGVAQDFFGFDTPTQQQGAGTGFVLTAEGVIVTNRHVVAKGTTSVSVVLADGTELPNVEVIGRTNDSDPLDIAFLKVSDKKGKTLQPVKLGDSAKAQVGDKVVAIGNALGQFQNTVTSGIVSGFGRSVQAGDGLGSAESLQNLIQTDAAINQGNSGGPLVNTSGEVIGINTAIAGDAQNIGFAIPINDVQGLIKSVLNKGKLDRPYLGVRYVNITEQYANQYNLSEKQGAYIPPASAAGPSIIADSPAAKAGLQEKDIILKIGDTTLDANNNLAAAIGKYSVGDKLKLTIKRGDKQQTVEVTLDAAPAS